MIQPMAIQVSRTPNASARRLAVHEDRLFSPEPTQRAIARRLYREVSGLPIISPHGHTDPDLVRERRAVLEPDRAAARARSLSVPDAVQPGHRARSARRALARGRVERRSARRMAHPRIALAPVPRHAVGRLARADVRQRLRHRCRVRRRHGGRLLRHDRCRARDAGVPSARLVRTLQHRSARDHRIARRHARAPPRDSRERLERTRDQRLPARPRRRPRGRPFPRCAGPLRRDERRGRAQLERLPRGAPQAPGSVHRASARHRPITATRQRRRPTCRSPKRRDSSRASSAACSTPGTPSCSARRC